MSQKTDKASSTGRSLLLSFGSSTKVIYSNYCVAHHRRPQQNSTCTNHPVCIRLLAGFKRRHPSDLSIHSYLQLPGDEQFFLFLRGEVRRTIRSRAQIRRGELASHLRREYTRCGRAERFPVHRRAVSGVCLYCLLYDSCAVDHFCASNLCRRAGLLSPPDRSWQFNFERLHCE